MIPGDGSKLCRRKLMDTKVTYACNFCFLEHLSTLVCIARDSENTAIDADCLS